MFTFRLGTIGIASTALYSIDRSLFTYAARGATNRALARLHTTVTLDEAGRPVRPGQRTTRPRLTAAATGERERADDRRDRGARGGRRRRRRPPDRAAADPAARPDLALLAGPDGDRRRRRPVHHQPPRVRPLRPAGRTSGRRCSWSGIGGSIVGIIVQPTVGYISDFTVSRWGRRKPYIVFGSLLDVVFLVGIANANTVLALAAFVILLSFSTNIARGPFQGYVPDLVAEPQVGLASGLVGMMQIVGNVTGFVLVSLAVELRRHVARPVRGRDRRARHDARASRCGSAGACRRGRGRAGRGRGSPARPGPPTSSRSARSCGCSSRGCCS